MPELPEVEVLARYLQQALRGRSIRRVTVRRPKSCRPTNVSALEQALVGCHFRTVTRRGKYLVFQLKRAGQRHPQLLLGHLGMTGRMFVVDDHAPIPKHAAVEMQLDRGRFIFEDTRYFGRLTLGLSPLDSLGPEPLAAGFDGEALAAALRRSRQAIKIRLLDQSVVAGIGNIYASEALYRARISPRRAAHRLTADECRRLGRAIRGVLAQAIRWGSTVPLNWSGKNVRDRLFYYGRAEGAPDVYEERLRVYDRAGEPCPRCRTPIRRITQAARSTYYCPQCQTGAGK